MPLGANKAAIMGVAGVSTGDVVLLSSQTASNSASISFTSGIDSTYGEYIVKFYNISPATNSANFQFQGNVASGSGYNETVTTTFFYAYHAEDGSSSALNYHTSHDQAQGTDFITIAGSIDNAADAGTSGELHIFNPASTTYVKHFYSTASLEMDSDYSTVNYMGGYINQTGAIDEFQFKMSSGNFDGTIKLWGVL